MEHLFSDSNIDILGISECWLIHSSPTAAFQDIIYLEKIEKQGEEGEY